MTYSHRLGVRAVILGLGLAACHEGPKNEFMVVDDREGVEVVELEWDRVPVTAEVSADPEWIIGDESAEEFRDPLFEVQDVEAAGESVVVIAEGSTQEILWIDLAAGAVSRLGGAGDGPAEFRGLTSLLVERDGGLSALDAERNRIVVLDPDGEVLGEESLGAWRTPRTSPFLVRSGDGTRYLLQVGGVPVEWTEGWSRMTAPIIRLDPTRDTLTSVPGNEVVMVSDLLAHGVLPFGATAVAAGAREGIWIGDTRDPEITLWKNTERPEAVIRWTSEIDDLRMDRRSRQDAQLDTMDDEWGLWEPMYEAVPESEPLPAFHALLSTGQGEIWIGRHEPIDALLRDEEQPAYEWLVIHVEESEAYRVATPPGFRPTRIGDEHLLGVYRDSMGVETVRKYVIDSRGSPN